MPSDQATLFAVATSITGLLGVFLLMLWLQDRTVRAFAWWGGAYLIGASAVLLWSAHDEFSLMTPEEPTALLFLACGMILNGARLFQGRAVQPVSLFVGAVAWIVATQFPAFADSAVARPVFSSIVIASYAFLTAFELRRERRRELASHWLGVAIPLLHSVVFLAPVVIILMVPEAVADHRLFAVFAFQTIIYVVGTAFIVVVMAKERVAQVHKTAAMTDPLTGLFNRRAFFDAANCLIERQARASQAVSVLLFDLDRFKSINDRFGHSIGDEALKTFAATASGNMRATDVIGRLGGEEFAAILPAGAMEAGVVAERLREAFQQAGAIIAEHEVNATVSAGVASTLAPVEAATLLARADVALYRAKNAGRNRVEFEDSGGAPTVVAAATPVPVAALIDAATAFGGAPQEVAPDTVA
ncbi:MAG: GGDEF domain-containing protein [Rhizobiales bacterium]|nr:GGDEF domain-containing protein [Hyphomicrobiales bacterium]